MRLYLSISSNEPPSLSVRDLPCRQTAGHLRYQIGQEISRNITSDLEYFQLEGCFWLHQNRLEKRSEANHSVTWGEPKQNSWQLGMPSFLFPDMGINYGVLVESQGWQSLCKVICRLSDSSMIEYTNMYIQWPTIQICVFSMQIGDKRACKDVHRGERLVSGFIGESSKWWNLMYFFVFRDLFLLYGIFCWDLLRNKIVHCLGWCPFFHPKKLRHGL